MILFERLKIARTKDRDLQDPGPGDQGACNFSTIEPTLTVARN